MEFRNEFMGMCNELGMICFGKFNRLSCLCFQRSNWTMECVAERQPIFRIIVNATLVLYLFCWVRIV